jgi:hypothetical protein
MTVCIESIHPDSYTPEIIVVTVTPYRTTDRLGREVEVDQFLDLGSVIQASGVVVRRDGTPGVRRIYLTVAAPAAVIEALKETS